MATTQVTTTPLMLTMNGLSISPMNCLRLSHRIFSLSKIGPRALLVLTLIYPEDVIIQSARDTVLIIIVTDGTRDPKKRPRL